MNAAHENALLRAAVCQWLRYSHQCILVSNERAPCYWYGVPDVVAMRAKRTLIEVEIKRTFSDFKANGKKRATQRRATAGSHEHPEQYYFCVPRELVERVKPLLPAGAGLLTLGYKRNAYTGVPEIEVVVGAEIRKPSRLLNMREVVQMLKCQSGSLVTALSRVARLEGERTAPAPAMGGTTTAPAPLPKLTPQREAFFVPPDFPEANHLWKANCGPTAFAALMSAKLATVRGLFEHFPARPYTNVNDMREAMLNSGRMVSTVKRWPAFGVALVQWTFANQKPSMSRSHWIAVDQPHAVRMVYDCNGGRAGAWMLFENWERHIVPDMLDTYRGGKLKPLGYRLHVGFEIK